jgi:transcriptional repressor NrdR
MKCPFCNAVETKVTDSRESSDLETRRRRECEKCGKRFTTYERIETSPLIIIKKDGRRENFSPEKVKGGILKSCEKRPVSIEKIDKIVKEIEASLRNEDKAEISSKVIGEMIMKKLKKIDKVAYVRFASVYRDFKDVEDFKKELKGL